MLRWATPQVLEVLARSALALSETKSGANTLALILSLEPPGAECAARHQASSSLCTLVGGHANSLSRTSPALMQTPSFQRYS